MSTVNTVNLDALNGLLQSHLLAAAPAEYEPDLDDPNPDLVALDLCFPNGSAERQQYQERGFGFYPGFECAVKLVAAVLSNPIGDNSETVKAIIDEARKEVMVDYDARPIKAA